MEKRQRSLEHVKYLLDDKEVEMQRMLAVNRERVVFLEREFDEANIVAQEREVQLTSRVREADRGYQQLQKELDGMKVELGKAEEEANIQKVLAVVNGDKLKKLEEIATDLMNQLAEEKIISNKIINQTREELVNYESKYLWG